MQTIAEYEYLNRDELMQGVVDWLTKESPMLNALSMRPMQGNSLKYNVSTVLPPVQWTVAGTQLSEGSGTFVQRTADIYRMIQNQYTDKGEIEKNPTQNPETRDMELAAQAMAQEFEDVLIFGQTSTTSNSLQYKGLFKLLAEIESESTVDLDGATVPHEGNNSQVLVGSATSAQLTMAMIDALIDMCKPGKPDVLLMSRMTRRYLNTLQRASGGSSGTILEGESTFGIRMETFDHIPLYIDDWIPDNLQDGSGSVLDIQNHVRSTARAGGDDNSVIFALQLGENKVTGLQAANLRHERDVFSANFDAVTNRLIWQVGLAAFRKFSIAGLVNFSVDS